MEKRLPLETTLNQETPEGQEIISIYRPEDHREVVERYERPLPQGLCQTPAPVPKKKSRRGLWIFLGILLTAILLSAGAWALNEYLEPEEDVWEGSWETFSKDEEEITIPSYPYGQGAELHLTAERGEKRTPQEVYAAVNPAVVLVAAELDHGASLGTGVIFREDGYLITNYHVVEGGRDCMVMLNSGLSIPAAYVAGNAEQDLAVLKVKMTGLPTATFGDSESLTVGDTVYAIGNPLGMELRGTFTNGIVSAIDRDVLVDGRTMTLIQTNAALNSGNSGGPLVDEYGHVVGINVIKMSSEYSSVEGLGFAIPSASVERLVNDLLTYGEARPEPLLGMSVRPYSEEVEPGVLGLEIVEVTPEGSADRAGMQKGDYLIAVNGAPVQSSRDVFRARRQLHLGDQLPLTLWRDGERLEIVLDLDTPVGDQ